MPGRPEQGQARGAGLDGRLDVAGLAVAVGEVVEVRAPPTRVEGRRDPAHLLEIGERLRVLSLLGRVGGEAHEQSRLEVGLHQEAAANLLEERAVNAQRLVLELVGLGHAVEQAAAFVTQPCQELIRVAAHARVRLGEPAEQLAADPVRGLELEQSLIRDNRLLEPRGRERKVRGHARPQPLVIVEEVRRGHAQTLREIGQRGHGRSGDAFLEGADVGLGVAIARELRLCQVRGEARRAEATADPLGQLMLVGDDPSAGGCRDALGYVHGTQCTRPSTAS